ncbi:hypothetical protein [Bacillus sp. CGMCC 1.16541]|uniref:hypothetical protein n=1 Tax=Bacillus sp. CGMCC 1.16541 TaxID=2185143 RepID=UPI000D72A03C|nr:hypothetical protein [Bacillus sp. CGMCC 1.16541]
MIEVKEMNVCKWSISLLAVIFLITGCGTDEAEKTTANPEGAKEEKIAEKEASESKQAARTIEEVNQQQSGVLVKRREQEVIDLGMLDFSDFKNKEIAPKVEKELAALLKNYPDASSDDIYHFSREDPHLKE